MHKNKYNNKYENQYAKPTFFSFVHDYSLLTFNKKIFA